MRFALFYEIPVARPWGPDCERLAYQHTIEQAVAGEQYGWDAFWTVEHHFLEEYSHCSNPEVLYGAIAALHRADAPRLRRAPHAEAVQPPGAHGRVGGRARPHLQRSRRPRHRSVVDPGRAGGLRHRPGARPRGMWQEAIGHVVGCWTNDEYEFEGEHWSMPKRRVQPKPIQ